MDLFSLDGLIDRSAILIQIAGRLAVGPVYVTFLLSVVLAQWLVSVNSIWPLKLGQTSTVSDFEIRNKTVQNIAACLFSRDPIMVCFYRHLAIWGILRATLFLRAPLYQGEPQWTQISVLVFKSFKNSIYMYKGSVANCYCSKVFQSDVL